MKPITILHNFGKDQLLPKVVVYKPNGVVTVHGTLVITEITRFMGCSKTTRKKVENYSRNMTVNQYKNRYIDDGFF